MDAKQLARISSIANLFVGLAALALLTWLCFSLGLSFAATSFLYLILIVGMSLRGSGATSSLLSIVAVVCLNYFFTEPIHSFGFTWQGAVELCGLLATSLIVTGLVRRARRLADRLRVVLDRIPAFVWTMAPDGSATFLNERYREFTGLSSIEAPSGWIRPFDPEDRSADEWRAALAAGTYFEKEAQLRGADGESRRFVLRALPQLDAQGRVVEWYGTASDVEDRRRAEEALREQARLLDLTHDTVFVRDAKDVITYWNRGAEVLYGWTSEEAIGRVTHELLRTEFPMPLEDITAELFRAGRWEGELVHTKRDGTRVVVASRWSLHRDAQGRPDGVLETNHDVTARKAAEDALRGQAKLLEQTHDAIFTRRLHGPILYWNRGAQQLYGFTREEAIGRISHELLGTEHPMPADAFEAAIERDGAWIGELTHWTRDGRRIVVDSRQVLVREANGTRLVLETNRDITEHVVAAEALREAQAHLAHVSRVTTLGEVTASLAHEVNQPLAAIANNANACLGLLEPGSGEPSVVREALADIVGDAERASAIIERVRGFARRTPLERNPLQLAEIVENVVALVSAEGRARAVRIETDVEAGLTVIAGDRVQLEQVLINLVMNGMDAMSAVTERDRVLEIRGRTERQQGSTFARISVQDGGVGLDPGMADKLFEAFYTTKPNGMGLGLAISRSIVDAHGGRLWAEANSGPGATFSFSIPAAAAASS